MSNSSWLIDAVDDCARRSFHEDIDSWFNWFLVFTAVVVVGEEIAELYLEAANASKDAEIAKKQAAEANLRTEELRAQVQHRRLRREQKAKIREVLKGAPKYLVTVCLPT